MPHCPDRRRLLTSAGSLLLVSSCLSPIMAIPAVALTGPEKLVHKIANDVMRLARSGPANTTMQRRFISLLNRHANMNAIARFALGRYRRKLPHAQAGRYYRLVKAYIAGLFTYYSKDFRGSKLEIVSTRKSGNYYLINSRIKGGSKNTRIIWRVRTSGGRYRVTDVNIRGIWLSIRLREKFSQLLKRNKGDFGKLFAFLESTRSWVPAG